MLRFVSVHQLANGSIAIIWSKGREFTSPNIGRKLAEINPQAIRYCYYLDDVGFTPSLEQPAVTIGLICKFLTRCLQGVYPNTFKGQHGPWLRLSMPKVAVSRQGSLTPGEMDQIKSFVASRDRRLRLIKILAEGRDRVPTSRILDLRS